MGKISDAINNKWPANHWHRVVKVQMDNTTPHIDSKNKLWVKKRASMRIQVELVCQPAQSPDLNVLNLGLWNLVQSRQRKRKPMHKKFDLACGIQECFALVPLTTVNLCFVTLQNMMREVKNENGSDSFKTLQKRKYAPVEINDNLAFQYSDSDTETEDDENNKAADNEEGDNVKPPALRKPRLCKKIANKKINKTAGHV